MSNVTFKLQVEDENKFEQTQQAFLMHEIRSLGYSGELKKVSKNTYLVKTNPDCCETLSNYGKVD